MSIRQLTSGHLEMSCDSDSDCRMRIGSGQIGFGHVEPDRQETPSELRTRAQSRFRWLSADGRDYCSIHHPCPNAALDGPSYKGEQ